MQKMRQGGCLMCPISGELLALHFAGLVMRDETSSASRSMTSACRILMSTSLQADTRSLNRVEYFTAVVQHYSPVVVSGYLEEDISNDLRLRVLSNAQQGLEQLGLVHELYSCQSAMPMLSHCMVLLADAFMTHYPLLPLDWQARHASPSNTLRLSLFLLGENRSGFVICGPLQKVLAQRAQECGLGDVDEVKAVVRSLYHIDQSNIIGALGRLQCTQPSEQMKGYLDLSIAQGRPAGRTERTNSVASLLNKT